MKKTMMASVLHAPGDVRYEAVPLPNIAGDEVLIAVKAVGNCGSDLQRIMIEGTHVFPCIPGHEFSGQIVEVGSEVTRVKSGERVTASPQLPCGQCRWCRYGQYNLCENYDYIGSRSDGAFAEFIKIPEANVRVLPDSVSYEEGSMTDPCCVSLHGCKRAGGVNVGETVVVMGLGPIGMIAGQWGRILGARQVIGVDVVESKLKTAEGLGIDHCIDAQREDVVQKIHDLTDGDGGNLYIETAGSVQTHIQALMSAAKRARIVHIGRIYHDVTLPKEAFAQIFRKELHVYGSVNFNSSPLDDEWSRALHFLDNGSIKTQPLISHRIRIEHVGATFRKMYEKAFEYNKIIFSP